MIVIKVINANEAPRERTKKPSLEERVSHAIDCIYCNVNKQQAIKFLQKAHAYLDGIPRQTKERQLLLERVREALSPYGHYHLNKD